MSKLTYERAKQLYTLYDEGQMRHLCALRDVEIDRLKSENAKLRKLALDVHALHWSGLDCTECPWIGECDTDGGCPWLGIMRDHMADLGIEVPR